MNHEISNLEFEISDWWVFGLWSWVFDLSVVSGHWSVVSGLVRKGEQLTTDHEQRTTAN